MYHRYSNRARVVADGDVIADAPFRVDVLAARFGSIGVVDG